MLFVKLLLLIEYDWFCYGKIWVFSFENDRKFLKLLIIIDLLSTY
jgi:hypothetical protein